MNRRKFLFLIPATLAVNFADQAKTSQPAMLVKPLADASQKKPKELVSDFDEAIAAREAFAFVWNPNNHDYKARCIAFNQIVLSMCLGRVTSADLGMSDSDFQSIQKQFEKVGERIMMLPR